MRTYRLHGDPSQEPTNAISVMPFLLCFFIFLYTSAGVCGEDDDVRPIALGAIMLSKNRLDFSQRSYIGCSSLNQVLVTRDHTKNIRKGI